MTVLEEGGHIAEVFDKRAGVSPLWVPPWTSIEPSDFSPDKHSNFGTGADAKLLAGIMGHNLCLDLFGGPSPEEAAAGFTVHGEASVDRYDITESSGQLLQRLTLPMAQLKFERSVQLHGQYVRIREVVENLSAMDRPLAWTQHVTLGPPFLDPATTQFRASMTRSVVSASGSRLQRLPDSGERVFMANRSSPGWRAVGPASDAQDRSRQRLYRPSG